MEKPILIRGARQLLTLRGTSGARRGHELGDLAIIQDGAVLITGRTIRNAGPSRQVENLAAARGAEEINANGRVVLPGFIDSHTHLIDGSAGRLDLEAALARASGADVTDARGGFLTVVRALRRITGRALAAQAVAVLKHCARQGTTTLESKSGWGITEAGELKILRAHAAIREAPVSLIPTFVGARFLADIWNPANGEYIDWACSRMLPLLARRKLASFAGFSLDSDFTIEQARRFLEAAKRLGFGLKIQAGPRHNPGVPRLAVELGAASVDVAQVDEDDAAVLGHSSVVAVLSPGPAFYSGHDKYPAARLLIDHGAVLALATKYSPLICPSHNMQTMIFLACHNMAMTPAEAVSAATINAAHSLGLAGEIGSIEAGKRADLVMLSVPDYREIPYHFGVNQVEMTMKEGRVIYRAPEMRWLTG